VARINEDAPLGMQTHVVGIIGDHLGERGTPETLLQHLSIPRAADVIQVAVKINAYLERAGGDPFGQGQGDLIGALFPPPIAEGLIASCKREVTRVASMSCLGPVSS
jgi:hypothetical protein